MAILTQPSASGASRSTGRRVRPLMSKPETPDYFSSRHHSRFFRFKSWTIHQKLLAFLLAEGVLILFVVLLLGGWLGRSMLQRQVETRTISELEMVSEFAESMVDRSYHLLMAVASSSVQQGAIVEQMQGYGPRQREDILAAIMNEDRRWQRASPKTLESAGPLVSEASRQLQRLKEQVPALAEVFTTDEYGALVAASNPTSDYYQADESWWQEALAGGAGRAVIGEFEFDASAEKYAYSISLPVRDAAGGIQGIIKGVFDAQGLVEPLAKLRIGDTGSVTLLDDRGRVLLIDGMPGADAFLIQALPEMEMADIREMEVGIRHVKNPEDGRDQLSAFHELNHSVFGDQTWYLYFTQDWDDYVAPLQRLVFGLFLLAILLLGFLFFPGLAFGRYLTRPIEALARRMQWVAEGKYRRALVDPGLISGDDLGALMNAHNQMVQTLEKTTISRDELEGIFLAIPDFLFVLDTNGNIVKANPAACRELGVCADDFTEYPFYQVCPRQNILKSFYETEPAARDAFYFEEETVCVAADGREVPVAVTASVMPAREGKEPLLICMARDMTERFHAQEELRRSEERFRQLAENIREVFWISNLDGSRMLYVSPAYETIWGRPVKAIYENANNWVEGILPEDRARVKEAFNEWFSLGQFDVEYQVQRPDGSIRWVRDRGFPVRDREGKIYRIAGIAEDITARKKLDRERQRLSTAFENALEGVAEIDADGKFLTVNTACAGLMGWSTEELLGMRLQEVVFSGDLEHWANARRKLESEAKAEIEIRCRRRDESTLEVQLVLVRTEDNAGRPGFFVFFKDIGERRSRESLKLQAEFVSTISHELRTPLHAIRESLRMVMQSGTGKMPADQAEMLHLANRNVERLGRLIDNALDLQKFEANAMSFEMSEGNIQDVIREVREIMKPLAATRGLALEAEINTPPVRLCFDHDKIQQVLLNLVSNALKYTEVGGVTIRTAAVPQGIRVEIQDTGIGIHPDDQARLFRPFAQVGGKKMRAGGTGLGLVIARKIIEAHEGKLDFESVPGQGSCFYFVLPGLKRPS